MCQSDYCIMHITEGPQFFGFELSSGRNVWYKPLAPCNFVLSFGTSKIFTMALWSYWRWQAARPDILKISFILSEMRKYDLEDGYWHSRKKSLTSIRIGKVGIWYHSWRQRSALSIWFRRPQSVDRKTNIRA